MGGSLVKNKELAKMRSGWKTAILLVTIALGLCSQTIIADEAINVEFSELSDIELDNVTAGSRIENSLDGLTAFSASKTTATGTRSGTPRVG